MKKIGFFIGHGNYLNHARVLCKSILENTSLTQEYQIFAMTPEYIDLKVDIPGVVQINVDVPMIYRSIPFIDKMLAAASFESNCADGYIWMDVESYFFKPMEFLNDAGIYVNPVDKRNIGDVYGGGQSTIWQIIYRYFQLSKEQPYVNTSVTKEKIYPYFNVGMVVVNKHKDLFKTVREAILELLDYDELKKQIDESVIHKIFMHQAIFSCAVMKKYGKNIKPLPYGVSYPLHLHEFNPAQIPMEDLISIRYDNYFDSNSIPLIWKHIFNDIKNDLKSNWYY